MELGAGRWAARRVRAGRAGRVRQASVSGRGAQGRGACERARARAQAEAQARCKTREISNYGIRAKS